MKARIYSSIAIQKERRAESDSFALHADTGERVAAKTAPRSSPAASLTAAAREALNAPESG
jgi:hypothetical protein